MKLTEKSHGYPPDLQLFPNPSDLVGATTIKLPSLSRFLELIQFQPQCDLPRQKLFGSRSSYFSNRFVIWTFLPASLDLTFASFRFTPLVWTPPRKSSGMPTRMKCNIVSSPPSVRWLPRISEIFNSIFFYYQEISMV